MRRLLFCMLLVLGSASLGCAEKTYRWNTSLLRPAASPQNEFSDEYITIKFFVARSSVLFALQNNSDAAIRVNWDNISFVMPDGSAKRVIHQGVRFMEKDAPMAPSTVPPGSVLRDSLSPSDYQYFVRGSGGGWESADLFDPYMVVKKKFQAPRQEIDPDKWKGKTFDIFFPIETKGIQKDYTFTIQLNSMEVSK